MGPQIASLQYIPRQPASMAQWCNGETHALIRKQMRGPMRKLLLFMTAVFSPMLNADLLDEVTSLVEWPVVLVASFENEFLQERELTIKHILDFLGVDSSIILDTDIRSNPSSKAKSKNLKKLIKRGGWWRVLLKKMIPSLKIRQIIKNRVQRLNISVFSPPQLSHLDRKKIYNLYFRHDIRNLEGILNRDMSHWNPDN